VSIGSLDAGLERWMSDAEGRLIKSRFAVVLAVCYVLFTATYVPLNVFSVGRDAHTLFLPGEERLPFLPIFEYLYVLTYFIAVLLIATVRDYASFRRLARATGLSLLAAYTTYLLFPVYFERPHLEVSSLHTWLLSLEYLDKPYNHFPSLHVTLSWLAVFGSQVSGRSRAGLSVLAAGISVSTLFVKQHYIADVLYGFVLAWITWRLAQGRAESTFMMAGRGLLSAAERPRRSHAICHSAVAPRVHDVAGARGRPCRDARG
jgi:membrane-associated phospholipid phosphatase